MSAPAPHTDLLLESISSDFRQRLIDTPKLETPAEPNRGFDWRPTVLLVAVGGAALLAYAYL